MNILSNLPSLQCAQLWEKLTTPTQILNVPNAYTRVENQNAQNEISEKSLTPT